MCQRVALLAVTALYALGKSPVAVILGLMRMGGSAGTGGLCYHPVAGWGGMGMRLPRRTNHEKN